ncbi:MAG: hypothetical protein GY721_04510, partial [Deltaproteobacteria bacterium]|nr:hypothetical protein [Deltaproteobacteria bacterium]
MTNVLAGVVTNPMGTSGTLTDNFDQALKVFSGEVLTAFEIASVFDSRQMFKTITSGHSAQFMVMGRADAGHRTKGLNLIEDAAGGASDIATDEEVVLIDRPITSHTFVDRYDEAI